MTAATAQVLEGLASGLSSVQMASRLFRSRQGIEYHIRILLQLFRAGNRTEVVAKAYVKGVFCGWFWPPKVHPKYVEGGVPMTDRVDLGPNILMDVAEESRSALRKHGPGKVLTNIAMPRGEKLAALGEEFGEVCRELTYDHNNEGKLEKELIQLGNLALAWAQAEQHVRMSRRD